MAKETVELSTHTIEFPYTRTLGPVFSEFLTGMRDGRIVGIRGRDGKVLCPPTEWDPATGEALEHDFVEVGPGGVVETWAWVTEPTRKHPLDRPFAFALVKLDGADTALLHAVDAGDMETMKTGMDYPMQLEYHEKICPVVRRYKAALVEGKLIGHKCPQCGLVYAPPRGYCPICVIETTDADEIQLADRGVVTNYTVVTPVEYHGQDKTERFAKASVQLDGGGMLNLQDLLEISVDDVRIGLRVEAVWVGKKDRDVSEIGNRSWGGADGAISGWRPTGEPDLPAEQFRDTIY